MDLILELEGLDCSNCASKIEEMSRNLNGVKESNFNFVTKKLSLNLSDESDYDQIAKEITAYVNTIEPDVKVVDLNDNVEFKNSGNLEFELNGLTCADCAGKIEEKTRNLKGINSADLNFVTKKLNLEIKDINESENISKEIKEMVTSMEPGVEVIDISNSRFNTKDINLELSGLNCSDCASKIVNFTKSIKGVEDAEFNFATKKFKVDIRKDSNSREIKDEIEDIIHTLEPDVDIIDLDIEKKLKGKEKSSAWANVDKEEIIKILISTILTLVPWIFGLEGKMRFGVYFIAYLIVGHKIILQAVKNTLAGVPFDENFLMTIATIGAFVIGEYPEAVMVMLLYQIGETMQSVAVNYSRDSITSLLNIRPDYANLKSGEEIKIVDPNDVKVGDIIVIKPGERVPLDGIVVEGKSSLDTSNITGESLPRSVKVGEEVYSGVVNLQGLLSLRVTKEFGDSTITKVLDLVENASSKKAETENFITKFARYYTPVVVFVAMAIAIIPVFMGGNFSEWLYRACVFLVISCPCALVISVPLGFFGGLGGASKAGVLIKGSNYLEALTDVDTMVFDKTGTITEGVFEVTEIQAYSNYSEDEILEIAALGESYSNHPIASSILKKYNKELDTSRLNDYKDLAGKGIEVEIDGHKVLLGNKTLFDSRQVNLMEIDSIGTIVYVGMDGKHIGTIVVSDRIKSDVKEDLKEIKKLGINKLIMLSGDNQSTADKVGQEVGMTEIYGDLLPQGKVEILENILKGKSKKEKVAFVGDGVNDAPVLARADVGIAMGALGSDAAIEASDIVIMTDTIGKIPQGIRIAKNTKRIVTQNIVLALGVKLIVLGLGALGSATMWQAVFADVGVSIIAILNSIRALNIKEN